MSEKVWITIPDHCQRKGCDGHYVARQNRNNGEWFLGCTSYPDCRSTIALRSRRELMRYIKVKRKAYEEMVREYRMQREDSAGGD